MGHHGKRPSFSSLLLFGLQFLFGITRAEHSADDLIGTWTGKECQGFDWTPQCRTGATTNCISYDAT